MMRELKSNLLIWPHLVIEWQRHCRCLKINEVQWKFPSFHLFFETRNIKVSIPDHIMAILLKNIFVFVATPICSHFLS